MEKFSSFSYLVRNDFIYIDKVEVRVFFIYLDKGVVSKSLFLKKVNNKPERLYITDAKKIVKEMIEKGTLEKYAKESVKRTKNKKAGIAFAAVMIGALVIAGASTGIYFAINRPLVEAKIELPEINGLVFDNPKAYVGKDYDTNISVNATLTDNLVLPDEIGKIVSGNRMLADDEYTYYVSENHLNGTLHIPGKYIEGNIKIDLKLITFLWYKDARYLNSLTKEDVTKENPDGSVGVVQFLKVNGLDHKVRLIGVDQDVDAEGNTIHTTWEFVNLISDANGYSLAVQWNDTNDGNNANHHYNESTIHNALNGVGVSNVLWAQKGEKIWSNDYKCSVLDMLNVGNPGLVDAIKAPSKFVNINNGSSYSDWDDTATVKDKLFLLTPTEMGYSEDKWHQELTTFTYAYYKGHTSSTDAVRIKKQINGTEALTKTKTIPSTAGQIYQGEVTSYAGYNSEVDDTGGGRSWLRSPFTGFSDYAWVCYHDGYLDCATVHSRACSVAPAFCL